MKLNDKRIDIYPSIWRMIGFTLINLGSPDKPRGLSIQPCKSEKEEPYIRHSSQGRSECLYLRIE